MISTTPTELLLIVSGKTTPTDPELNFATVLAWVQPCLLAQPAELPILDLCIPDTVEHHLP